MKGTKFEYADTNKILIGIYLWDQRLDNLVADCRFQEAPSVVAGCLKAGFYAVFLRDGHNFLLTNFAVFVSFGVTWSKVFWMKLFHQQDSTVHSYAKIDPFLWKLLLLLSSSWSSLSIFHFFHQFSMLFNGDFNCFINFPCYSRGISHWLELM